MSADLSTINYLASEINGNDHGAGVLYLEGIYTDPDRPVPTNERPFILYDQPRFIHYVVTGLDWFEEGKLVLTTGKASLTLYGLTRDENGRVVTSGDDGHMHLEMLGTK